MKKLTFLLTAILILAPASFLHSLSLNDSAATNLVKEFQGKTENWRIAYNSKNAQNLIQFYIEDAVYVSSHVAGLEAKGRDKLISNFQNGMKIGGFIDSIEILKIDISGDIATLLCKYKATNNGVTVIGRNLLVIKNINGNWLISIHMTVV